jgi:hypothetical protein
MKNDINGLHHFTSKQTRIEHLLLAIYSSKGHICNYNNLMSSILLFGFKSLEAQRVSCTKSWNIISDRVRISTRQTRIQNKRTWLLFCIASDLSYRRRSKFSLTCLVLHSLISFPKITICREHTLNRLKKHF